MIDTLLLVGAGGQELVLTGCRANGLSDMRTQKAFYRVVCLLLKIAKCRHKWIQRMFGLDSSYRVVLYSI